MVNDMNVMRRKIVIAGASCSFCSNGSQPLACLCRPRANFGFETPSIPSSDNGYEYNPSAARDLQCSQSGSGIVGNVGSGSGAGFAIQTRAGRQAAFIQETGTITQDIPGFTTGQTTRSAFPLQYV